MIDGLLARQLAQLGLSANAIRPLHGKRLGVGAFFAGWLSTELAPHAAVLTALDTSVHLARHGVRGRGDVLSLALAATNVAAGVALTRTALRSGDQIESALVDALGADYRSAITRESLPTDLHTTTRSLVMPFRLRDSEVVKKRRIAYAPGGRRFELDVYHRHDLPTDAPVLLQIHGGAWIFGTKDQQGVPLMLHMAARGWVCVAVNYPLSPKTRWPGHLIAIKRALQWIREHGADFGADPSFVAVTGGSAGGHLAAMVGLTANEPALQPGFEDVDTSVQACAPHYGVYDFTDESGAPYAAARLESLLRRYVMPRDADYPQDYRAASPLYRVRSDAPPFLVVHGTNDTLVPIVEARSFVGRLRAVAEHPVAYAEIIGAQHAFDVLPSLRSAGVLRGVARFLEWTHATRDRRPALSGRG